MKKFIILSTLLISLSLVPIQAANENTFKKSYWGHPATIIVESALILAGITLSIACKKAIINKYKEKITIIKNLKKHLGVKKLTKELLESPDAIAFAKQHNQLELLDDLIENFDQMKTIQNKYNWGWIGLVGGIFISGASTIALLTSIRTFIKDKKAEEEFNKKEKERLKKEADEKKRIKEKERKKREEAAKKKKEEEEAKRLEEERKRKIREKEKEISKDKNKPGTKLIKLYDSKGQAIKPTKYMEFFGFIKYKDAGTKLTIEFCYDGTKEEVVLVNYGVSYVFIKNKGYTIKFLQNELCLCPVEENSPYSTPETYKKALGKIEIEEKRKEEERKRKVANFEYYPYNLLERVVDENNNKRPLFEIPRIIDKGNNFILFETHKKEITPMGSSKPKVLAMVEQEIENDVNNRTALLKIWDPTAKSTALNRCYLVKLNNKSYLEPTN